MIERITRPPFRPDEVQRTGYTADHVGFRDEPLGWIKPEIIRKYAGQPGSRAHRVIATHFNLADGIAKRLHELNENARPIAGGPFLADPEARLKNLEAFEKQAEAMAGEIEKAEYEHMIESNTIEPHDFSNLTLSESILLMGRRQALLAMKPEDRFGALDKDPYMRKAVLQDRSPATSGLNEQSWKSLFDRELKAQRPDDVARLADEAFAIREAKRTAEAVKKGLAAERVALGQADWQRAKGPRALPEWKPSNEGAA